MKPLHIFAAIAVAALWGGNFVAAKTAVSEMPPLLITSLRFFITALILLPFYPLPSRNSLKGIAIIALTLGVLHLSMLFVSIRVGLDIAACAVVAQMGVPFSCLLSAFFFKDRIGMWRGLGLLVSFAGIFIIAGSPDIWAHPMGFMIALLAAFFWGLSNIQIKKLEEVPIFQFLGWMALMAAPVLLLVSCFTEGAPFGHIMSASWRVWVSLTYTVIGSTLGGYGLWYFLIRSYPVSQVTPYSLLTPLFSIAAGQVFFHEPLTWQVLVGGGMTVAGVAVIVMRHPRLAQMGEAV